MKKSSEYCGTCGRPLLWIKDTLLCTICNAWVIYELVVDWDKAAACCRKKDVKWDYNEQQS